MTEDIQQNPEIAAQLPALPAQLPVSRVQLDGMSTDELVKLADTNGIDIPPELERIFIIEEILEVINAENDYAPGLEENPDYSETALLPKQYNISFIEVIIRDPLWVFVFWEVKGHDRETHENAKDFKGYFLRVIRLDSEGKERKQESLSDDNAEENSFTVSVSIEDNARYIGFAGQTISGINSQKSDCYIIKLGVIRGNQEILLTSSDPFSLPKASENEIIADMSRNNLIRLSGVQDLSITKNTDRQARIKR